MHRPTLALGLALSAGPLYAADTATAPASPYVHTYDPLKVIGQRLFPYQEGMVLDQRYIDEQIRGNGDIGGLLRINPNVQFDETAQTSRNMGEIRPADISINGGLYYQNAFLLDGASFNNDLDPGGSTIPADTEDVPSHSQGIALDSSLIGRLTVYDSNVPAAYGGFNGGVVEAESRKARDAFAGKIALRMSRSAWNRMHIAQPQYQGFEDSATEAQQPRYDKYELRATLEGRTRNGLGLIGNIVRTRSQIPLRGYTGGASSSSDANAKEQVRQNTSASLRADWNNGQGLELGASATYAPTDETYFIPNAKDSFYDIRQGGPVLSLRANLQSGAWTWRNTLSYSDLDSSRRGRADHWKSWARSTEKDWGTTALSPEGSWGDVDQSDRSLGYKFSLEREAAPWGRSEHRLQFGLEYRDRRADYERLREHQVWMDPTATLTCTDRNGEVDVDGCSTAPVVARGNRVVLGRGQFFATRNLYRVGGFSASNRELGLFAQDDIRLGRWNLRPGLRIDRDSLMGQTTTAPRLALSWDVFGDRATLLTAGVNRYYGRNFFAFKLREERERLKLEQTRTRVGPWRDAAVGRASYRLEDLRIPYSDELSAGWNQRWAGLDFNFKYVRRDNRDEVLRESFLSHDTSGYYQTRINRYVNKGRSRSQTYTLSVAPAAPLDWAGSQTTAQLALDYTDVRRNYTDYETAYSDRFEDWVRYDGALMHIWEMPANSYNRPWTARLATQTRLPAAGLLWSNFLRYRSGYRGTETVGSEIHEGRPIQVIEPLKYPAGFTWDSAVEWTLPLPSAREAYARLEVQNLTDRSNLVKSNSLSAPIYEPGRSYWVELGYRF